MNNYYVVNLKSVKIENAHPYTLVFKGYIPTYGQTNKLYTFKYDGDVVTDATMPKDVKDNFSDQLMADYGCGIKFDIKTVEDQLKNKDQYRMVMS